MAEANDGFSHPRCYARVLGDCSTKITNEHFFSEALGREIGGTVTVWGMAWQNGQQHPNRLANAKILCGRHNSILTTLDSGIAAFFASLRDFDRRLCAGEGGPEQVTVVGTTIERWFLKVLCGLTAANVTTIGGKRSSITLEDSFIPPLFGRESWPTTWRLGCRPEPIPTANQRGPNTVNFELVTRDGQAKGMQVRFNGLVFGLRTESRMDDPGWSWRPAGIRFLAPGLVKTINLTWPMYEAGYVDLWAASDDRD